jgi:hypothetical protein
MILLLGTYAALVALLIARAAGKLPEYHPIEMRAAYGFAFQSQHFQQKALGALSGFEYVAILAGETRACAQHFRFDRGADHRAHVHPRHQSGWLM